MEGLRLTLGLGGDKAGASTQSGRLGAQGKVAALRTILAFVRASLEDNASGENGYDEVAGMFGKVFGDEGEGNGNVNRKGKGRQMEIDGDMGVVDQSEGFLSGCGDWGLEGPTDAWEIGRLETEASLAGKGAETEVVAVSQSPLGVGPHVIRLTGVATLHPTTSTSTRHLLGSGTNGIFTLLIIPHHYRPSLPRAL